MAHQARLRETILKDAEGNTRAVAKGDKVTLSPHLTSEKKEFLLRFLDEDPGPYTISWIGRWPCGGVNLYFKMPYGREPGAEARDFVAIDQ